MKSILFSTVLILLAYGCSKSENPIQSEQAISVIGSWNIKKMTIDDAIVNSDSEFFVIRKVVVKADSIAHLYWYNKMVQTSIDTGRVSQKDTAIVVTTYSPMDIVISHYKFEINNVLTLYYKLPGITRKYIYDKEK